MKFKAGLLLLGNVKLLVLLPKFLALFLSIWFYALFFGWKFAVAFVLLILVHELGHYVTFRNFASRPTCRSSSRASRVRCRARPGTKFDRRSDCRTGRPIYGLAASGVCYAVAVTCTNHFGLPWRTPASSSTRSTYCRYRRSTAAASPRPSIRACGSWARLRFSRSSFCFTFGRVAVRVSRRPSRRAAHSRALRRYVDPRFAAVPRTSRIAIAAIYFCTMAIAVGGAAATYFDPRAHL